MWPVEVAEGCGALPEERMGRLAGRLAACRKVMVLAGCHLPDSDLQEALACLGEWDNVIVLSETPANAGKGRQVGMIDRVLATVAEEERGSMPPTC